MYKLVLAINSLFSNEIKLPYHTFGLLGVPTFKVFGVGELILCVVIATLAASLRPNSKLSELLIF